MAVRVDGLRQLVRDLQELGLTVDDLKDVFATIAARGADAIAQATPARSGALLVSVRGNRAKSKAVVRAGGARVKYAAVVNYGWPKRNIPGQGFMQAGEARIEPELVPMLDVGIDRVLKQKGFK